MVNRPHKVDDRTTTPAKITLQNTGTEKEFVSLNLEVDILGEIETVSRDIKKSDFEKYNLDLNFDEPVSLDEFMNLFSIEFDEEGEPKGIQIELNRSNAVSAVVDQRETKKSSSTTENKAQSLLSIGEKNQDDSSIPAPPKDATIEGKENQRFYERMVEDADSQPSVIRRIIYESQSLTREELNDKVEKEGYSRSSSGIPTTLRVLERLGEIQRDDDGEFQEINWTGKEAK